MDELTAWYVITAAACLPFALLIIGVCIVILVRIWLRDNRKQATRHGLNEVAR